MNQIHTAADPRPRRATACTVLVLTLLAGCAQSGEQRTADGKIIRIADDGTKEVCNAAPSTGNRPGVKAVNTTCPIVDADGADESFMVEWRGKNIAFCCPTCVRKFNRMNDAEKDAVLVKATTYVQGA